MAPETGRWFTKASDIPSEQDAATNPMLRWKRPHKHIRVAGVFGGSRARLTWADIDIAVCTVEKVGALSPTRPPRPDLLSGKCSGEYGHRRWPNRRVGHSGA